MAQGGRRDLSAERRGEILDAFERCIVERGLAGSSMRHVAAEAGVSQPLLMHHFGSRAGLVEALVRHVLKRCDAALAEGLAGVGDDGDVEGLLELLFGGRFSAVVARDDGLFPELQAAATRDPETRSLVHAVYTNFQRDLAGALRKAFPSAAPSECRRVAYGLVCLVESNELMRELALPGRRASDALECGRLLVASLGRAD